MENLLTIGEFAEATRLSPKALRLYAEHGLLTPTRVDGGSGYRYYRAQQVRVARVIALLRAADMPLREVRRFLVDPKPELLDEYEAQLRLDHGKRLEVLDYVRRVIEETAMFEVKVKQVEAQRYVSRTENVRIEVLPQFIESAIEELSAGGRDGAPFAIFHGAVNETDEGPVEVGVPRASGDRELAGGEVAYTEVDTAHFDFPDILGAYDAIARWATENGRNFGGSPREVYLDRADLECEVTWPLR